MTRFKGAQRGIALLACSVLAACAIDNRVGKVEMSPDDNAESDDPVRAPDDPSPGVAGATGAEGTEPGATPAGSETVITPVLPAPGGAGGSTGELSGSAPMGAGSAGSGQGGAAAGGGSPPGSGGGNGSGSGPGASPPPPVTEPETVGGCFNQLLHNGDFERGSEGWAETSELRDLIVWRGHPELEPTGVTPQAGNYLAWIGGVPSGEFTMYRTRLAQQVEIPADAVSLTFTGYAWAAQPEPGLPQPDWAILEALDPDPASSYLWRIQYWEEARTGTWVPFESTLSGADVARFAGKTVTIQVHNMPNANGKLSVWLDSLRLEARCPR